MSDKVKSGKEILDDFFSNIQDIPNIDESIANSLVSLYEQGRFTDTNIKNELQNLRDQK